MSDSIERLKSALADRYTIEHELGAGGMATVYLAEDLRHKRKVAVKVLRPELAVVLGAYDVGPNDQRFIMIQLEEGDVESDIVMVLNWFEELKAKVGN